VAHYHGRDGRRSRFVTPVPRPSHRFWRRGDRRMLLSHHSGPCIEPHRFTGNDPIRGPSFRTTQAPTFHRRRSPRLGPRSLDPDHSFWSACAERIWDQMPPTDFCKLRYFDVRARTRAPVPRTDGGHDLLRVLTRRRPLPCGSGCARRAALRPVSATPRPVLPALRRLARPRCRRDRATTERLSPPVCSDDRRARVQGPSEGRVFRGGRGAF
jgi:hypothetical protein